MAVEKSKYSQVCFKLLVLRTQFYSTNTDTPKGDFVMHQLMSLQQNTSIDKLPEY